MPCFAGLDVSKHSVSICVRGADGGVLFEGATANDPRAIVAFLRGRGLRYRRVGLEAGGFAPPIYETLARAGLPVICIDAQHAHAILKTQRNKTDRSDARGIAEMMRAGVYKSVHVKTQESRRLRAQLTARQLVQRKRTALMNGIHGLLVSFGVKTRRWGAPTFARNIQALIAKDAFLRELIEPLLSLLGELQRTADGFEAKLRAFAMGDSVCRRLMTAPGIGTLTAVMYRSTIDIPGRFAHSRDVGPHLGLTDRVRQSGGTEYRVGASTCGDREMRSGLFLAAIKFFHGGQRTSALHVWAAAVAERRGKKRAAIAVARRLAVILHAMWVNETEFRWECA